MTADAPARAFAALRAFAAPRPAVERCDLCAVELDAAHDHLVDAATGKVQCACLACSHVLGNAAGTSWTLVRRRARRLADFTLTDAAWTALGLPIDLAFFVRSRAAGRVVALFPSPGGLVESAVEPAAWDALVAANPVMAELAPDTEALLFHRVGARRDHYLVSIDECYRLVGVMRRHWQGLSGGPEVQTHVARFFAGLDAVGATP